MSDPNSSRPSALRLVELTDEQIEALLARIHGSQTFDRLPNYRELLMAASVRLRNGLNAEARPTAADSSTPNPGEAHSPESVSVVEALAEEMAERLEDAGACLGQCIPADHRGIDADRIKLAWEAIPELLARWDAYRGGSEMKLTLEAVLRDPELQRRLGVKPSPDRSALEIDWLSDVWLIGAYRKEKG